MVCGMRFLLCIVAFSLLAASASSAEPSVTIPFLGTISGLAKGFTFDGRTYNVHEYLGIPYAEAPVRFQKPQPKSPFTAPYRAVKYGLACNQYSLPGSPAFNETSEDCLFLNVFAHAGNTSNTDAGGYPVMIWFHGGGFGLGSADPYHSDTLSGFGKVIVVTVNYRLAILGFLCTGDDTLPGNYGLWDQHLAIRWVHDYISFFGGDPGRVTLFGQSAGAFSVNFQSIFAGNKGLIHGVISESGSPTIREAYTGIPEAIASTRILAESLGCSKTDSQGMKNCFLAASARDINSVLTNSISNLDTFRNLRLTPCYDNDFIKVDPKRFASSVTKAGTPEEDVFSSVNFLNGANNDEGALYLGVYGITDMENFTIAKDEMSGYVNRTLVDTYPDGYPTELVAQAQAQYTDWQRPDDPVRLRDMYVKLNGDTRMIIPGLEMTKKHAFLNGSGDTYFYYFTGPVQQHAIGSPSWITGAVHGDELPYVFGFEPAMLKYLALHPPNDRQIQLAKAVMTFWTNFAKSGSPNQPVDVTAYLENGTPWPAYDLDKKGCLEITSTLAEAKQWFYAREDNFWTTLVPQILASKTRDCPPVENKPISGGRSIYQGHSLSILTLLFMFLYL